MLEDDNTDITVGEFVEMLWTECGGAARSEGSAASLTLSELLRYGHFRCWLEDSDERHPETLLNRQTAARIIHQFMVVELHVPDIADISAAEKLRDLYTCRVCANHIAQVYARGIMGAQELIDENGQRVLIFNHLGWVTLRHAQKILSTIRNPML